jgi:poly-gamma-glutamate synthesis protein (capsule biosynthesis protein)
MAVDGSGRLTLFLCGDVMTGRGVDQVMPHPSRPAIFEPYVRDAREYVALAEAKNGTIPRSVDVSYIWGDALGELDRLGPDARIINLETSITRRDDYWRGKGINYRMHPANVGCLTAGHIDVCVLANNHVLDFGRRGLMDTLEVLRRAGLRTAGAGESLAAAQKPALVSCSDRARVIVFGFGAETSGILPAWAARDGRLGVDLLPDLSEKAAAAIVERVRRVKGPQDLVVASIHWGTNWGFEVPEEHVRFAHWLVDGGVDVLHGHSSHHPRPIEVYRNRLILYGCGDFINDYEGIAGYEQYRDDLVVMYFATFAPASGGLSALHMSPMQIKRFRLTRVSGEDAQWLRDTLDHACQPFATRIAAMPDGRLSLRWGTPRQSAPTAGFPSSSDRVTP